MPTRRGTTNRKTGKTTPRTKPKTHWGGHGGPRRVAVSQKSGKAGAVSASASKK